MSKASARSIGRVVVPLAALAFTAVPAIAVAETDPGEAAFAVGTGLSIVAFSLVAVFFYALMPLLFIALMIAWVLVIIDVVQRSDWEFPNALQGRPSSNDKTMWLLLVLLASYIGAAVYYVLVMKPYPLKVLRAGGGPMQPVAQSWDPAPSGPAAPAVPSAGDGPEPEVAPAPPDAVEPASAPPEDGLGSP